MDFFIGSISFYNESFIFFGVVAVLLVTGLFNYFNETHPFIAGFVQFAMFATSGELLSSRILYDNWEFNKATAFKALVWGISGLFVTIMFNVLSLGTTSFITPGAGE